MYVTLVHDPAMDAYDLGSQHPLKAARVSLAVELMDAYGLLDSGATVAEEAGGGAISGSPGYTDVQVTATRAQVLSPAPATDDELELVHEPAYIDAVKVASVSPQHAVPRYGIGAGDNPAIRGMHEVSALIAGGTIVAVEEVLSGRAERSFAVAGGLHHAHRSRAAGFCVYNDPAVAIAAAQREHPGVRVMYIDIDAHHGDGVQEAFYDDPDVLTFSVHETGDYLFPGTGFVNETGHGEGRGTSLNLPLPPGANDECYALAISEAIAPAARAFRPDLIVAQCGADQHHQDPLAHQCVTLGGYRDMVTALRELAEEVCAGRLVATGGGGYGAYSVVPRAWTILLGVLLEAAELPELLPESWRALSEAASGEEAPVRLSADDTYEIDSARRSALLTATSRSIAELAARVPLLS